MMTDRIFNLADPSLLPKGQWRGIAIKLSTINFYNCHPERIEGSRSLAEFTLSVIKVLEMTLNKGAYIWKQLINQN